MKNRQEQMEEEALAYHKRNPDVWDKFEEFAFDRIQKGFKNFSASAIIQRIRWDYADIGGRGEVLFKIPNAHSAFYARWFMKKYPEHEGFFRTCIQKSAFKPAKVA